MSRMERSKTYVTKTVKFEKIRSVSEVQSLRLPRAAKVGPRSLQRCHHRSIWFYKEA